MTVVQEELIANVSETIVSGAFNNLVKENDTESLRTLYRLLSLVNQVDIMHSAWSDYIKVRIHMNVTDRQTFGVEMVRHPERDEEMIPALLSFKAHLDSVLRNSFNSDETFSAYLRESFEWVINRRRDKPAEYTAKYLDNILRKGDKGLASGESSVEEEMDRVLVLFRFVHGKDVFEAFYKKDLAKRLLLAKSASADAERSMLTKLKNGTPFAFPSMAAATHHVFGRLLIGAECGAQFTQKLEGMFKDIDVSQDFMKSFKEQRHATQIERNLHVNVLSQSWWPTYPEKNVILPESMVNALESFKEFWLKKQSGRKLMWRHALGHCILSADFPKVPHVRFTFSKSREERN